MAKKILIQSGHVVDPANGIAEIMDVLVEDGKIVRVAKKIPTTGVQEVLVAKGKLVTPGLVDLQVHLREPGYPRKETIASGLRAALKGGITSVVSMPNTNPVTDSAPVIHFQQTQAQDANLAHLFVAGAITKGQMGVELANIAEMVEAGVVAITDDGKDVQNTGLLKKALAYAKTFSLVVMSHCQEESLSAGGLLHAGKISTALGLAGISASAEEMGLLKNLLLAAETDAKLHILHVSTKGGVELLQFFQKKAPQITAETCPQYFILTDEICAGYNTLGKMYPPLRSEEHRQGIIKGLQNGTLSVISTDHAPHTRWDKAQSFENAAWGSVGLETSFALSYTHLVKNKLLSLTDLLRKMTVNPAKVISVPKGTLSAGQSADIVIFDLEKKWPIRVADMETKGKNCVFEGMPVFGKAETVLVDGVIKMRGGEIL